MGYHAKLSPSSAHRWTSCTASIGAQDGLPDEGSEAARLGTCQHQLSAECLEFGTDPQTYLGRRMQFWIHPESDSNGEDWESAFEAEQDPSLCFVHEVVVTQEMIDASRIYINFVQEQVSVSGGNLYVEQEVPIGQITGEKDGRGTSDSVIVAGDLLTTIDAKFGRVKVDAFDVLAPAHTDLFTGELVPEVTRINLQLALYLLGTFEKYGLFNSFKRCKAIIVQPYLHHVSEYSCTIEELIAVGEWIKAKAEETRNAPVFVPSEENCHFCRARFICKAREEAVLSAVLSDFDDIDSAKPVPITVNQLGSLYAAVGMIQSWCKDVMVRVFDELSSGREVVRNDGLHYKLVTGKKGDRQWSDAATAETTLKKMRMKHEQMYVSKLIGPSAAEKLATPTKKGKKIIAPAVLGATQWSRLQDLIIQRPGSPTIAIETDPRPAIENSASDFEDVPSDADNCADLF